MLDSGPTEADGDPESPLTDEQIDEKFDRFSRSGISESRAESIKDIAWSFGERSSLDLLYKAIFEKCDVSEEP